MTTCTICGQQVPVEELQEHMRIELLDPRWKSQRDALEARRAQQSELQRGANVESSLRSLAKARVDIFGTEADEEKRKKEEQEEVERRRQREKDVWDGHTASKDKTLDKFQSNVNFDEQIAALHRAKGLGPQVFSTEKFDLTRTYYRRCFIVSIRRQVRGLDHLLDRVCPHHCPLHHRHFLHLRTN